jgi:hypothetical protein
MERFDVNLKCTWTGKAFTLGTQAMKCRDCSKVMKVTAWEEKQRCRCGSTHVAAAIASPPAPPEQMDPRGRSSPSTAPHTRINSENQTTSSTRPPTGITWLDTTSNTQTSSTRRASTDPSPMPHTRTSRVGEPSANSNNKWYWVVGIMTPTLIFIGWMLGQSNKSAPPPQATTPSSVQIATPASTPQITPPGLSKEESLNLINRWLSARSRILAPPFDQELGSQLMTGKAYSDKIHGPSSDGTDTSQLEWLEKFNYYYSFKFHKIDEVRSYQVSGSVVTLDIVITEDKTMYDSKKNIVKDNSGLTTQLIRYTLQNDSKTWKIADFEIIQEIKSIKDVSSISSVAVIERYYRSIEEGNYEAAWNLLPENMRNNRQLHPHGFESFREWYNSIENIRIRKIKLESENSRSAIINFIGNYTIKSNKRDLKVNLLYYLIKDSNLKWKIEKVTYNKI